MSFLGSIAPKASKQATDQEARAEANRGLGPLLTADTSLPPPPSPDNSETQKYLQQAKEKERLARGRASTILTGGSGLEGQPTTSKRVLLGA